MFPHTRATVPQDLTGCFGRRFHFSGKRVHQALKESAYLPTLWFVTLKAARLQSITGLFILTVVSILLR
jgi:hypothetical protein